MDLEKIEKKTLRQKVYEKFRESIISGSMLPGQTFSLRELAEIMDVSIMPIREALWQMESEKIIIIENNKRMKINTLSLNELTELYNIRLFIETQLLEQACKNPNPYLIKKLEVILNDMKSSINSPRTYLSLNKSFHFEIYEQVDAPIYLNIINNLWLREAPYFAIQNKKAQYHIQIEPHEEMLEALRENSISRLKAALKKDMDGVIEHIVPQLDSLIEK